MSEIPLNYITDTRTSQCPPNFLGNTQFTLTISKFPGVSFYAQKVNIPSVTLPATIQDTLFNKIPRAGQEVKYAPLEVTFKVDAIMRNYFILSNYIRSLGDVYTFSEFGDLSPIADGFVDAFLFVNDPNGRSIAKVHYVNVVPTYLSELQFDSTATDYAPITAEAKFEYTYYNIEGIVDPNLTC
jgi:hypothetical protein